MKLATKYLLIAALVGSATPALAHDTPAAGGVRARGVNINTNVNTNVVGAHAAGHAAPPSVSVRGYNNNTNINTNVVHVDFGARAWANATAAYWKAGGAYWKAVAAFWGVRR